MAAPHVAGAAAILASAMPTDSREDVEAIRDTLVEEGNFDWVDNSGDGVKEPLLDVGEMQVSGPPTPVTLPVTLFAPTSATLVATVNPSYQSTTYHFEYGRTTSYGSKAPLSPKSAGSGIGPVEVSEAIEGLTPGATYHYRVVAENESGTSYGADETFVATSPPSWRLDGEELGESTEISFSGALTFQGESLQTTCQVEGEGLIENDEGQSLLAIGLLVGMNGLGCVTDEEGCSASGENWPVHSRAMSFSGSNGFRIAQDELPIDYGKGCSIDGIRTLSGSLNGKWSDDDACITYDDSPGLSYEDGEDARVSGELCLTDPEGRGIQALSPLTPALATTFGEEGPADGQLLGAASSAVDSAGNLWVVDYGNDRVQKFNSKGEYQLQFGSEGSGEGDLSWPTAITLDADGDLWIADYGNSRDPGMGVVDDPLSEIYRLHLMERSVHDDEAAAIAAVVARFEAETAPAVAAEGDVVSPWQRAALSEGVGAKAIVQKHLEGGAQWQS